MNKHTILEAIYTPQYDRLSGAAPIITDTWNGSMWQLWVNAVAAPQIKYQLRRRQ